MTQPSLANAEGRRILLKSRLIKVEMTIALPVDATMDEIEEWIRMECGHSGSISLSNPLIDHAPECTSAPMLTDTQMHRHSEAIDNQDGSYTIRYWTSREPMRGPTGIETVISRYVPTNPDAGAS